MNQAFGARWKKVSLPNKLTVVCTAIIAAATICYVIAEFRQLRKMSDTLIEMKSAREGGTDQANQVIGNMNWLARTMESSLAKSQAALDASIAASRTDQRAWLGIKDIKLSHALALG